MFGYVVPVKSKLSQQDFVLYRAFYCGMCKTIGSLFGQLPRYSVSYDSAFLAALVSDCLDYPEEIKLSACVGNPFKKKPMIAQNELMEKLAAVNIILCRYKLFDDVVDGKTDAKIAMKFFAKAYKKSVQMMPEADEIVKIGYENLRNCETSGCDSVDRVGHCFANMLKKLFALILGDRGDEHVLSMVYNVGKFIYIADALDDIEEDKKSGNYNVFLISYGKFENRRQFIEDNRAELEFLFASTVNKAIAEFNARKYTQSYTLLQNIVYYGLRDKTEQLFASDKKLDRPRI